MQINYDIVKWCVVFLNKTQTTLKILFNCFSEILYFFMFKKVTMHKKMNEALAEIL